MAVTVEYQAWDSATYNWLDNSSSTAAPQQINDKLSAWITAVNANASNTSKQLTIEKGPADSTSANFVGWVIKLDSSTSLSPFYFAVYTLSSGVLGMYSYETWTNSTSNGGYGTLSGSSSGASVNFRTSAIAAEFTVATETANGQEFFALGYKTDPSSSNYQGFFVLFKDTTGEWASYNGGSNNYGTLYASANPTPARAYGVRPIDFTSLTTVLSPLVFSNSGTLPSAGQSFTLLAQPASPSLLSSLSTSVGFSFNRYAVLADGTTCIAIGYGPIFVAY